MCGVIANIVFNVKDNYNYCYTSAIRTDLQPRCPPRTRTAVLAGSQGSGTILSECIAMINMMKNNVEHCSHCREEE
jgi:hypothetical protein